MEQTPFNNTILYIDDDVDDLQLLQEALASVNANCQIVEAHDGVEGLDRLHQMRDEGGLPCLIVLDINMPRLDGRKTFQLIRANEQLAHIPVVIFSTSNSELDKMFFKGKDVEYITKPIRFSNLVSIATRLLEYCHT